MTRRFAAILVLIAAPAAFGQTWTKGAGTTTWNTATNWNPATIQNLSTAVVNFTNTGAGTVNIISSVASGSLNFSNSTGSYDITSTTAVSLQFLSAINLTAAVTTQQRIDLANISTGSLLYTGTLTITNSSTAGGTLVIGTTTVIGMHPPNPTPDVFACPGSTSFL